jgi:GxxExxY protein
MTSYPSNQDTGKSYFSQRILTVMQHQDITRKIIGCAMKVHTELGNGFQEVIYQRALAIEMKKQALSFDRELEMEIFYCGFSIRTRRVDFFVEGKIMVELKALIKLEDVHLAQAMNYCQAYNLPVGLLEFRREKFRIQRVYHVNHPENRLRNTV